MSSQHSLEAAPSDTQEPQRRRYVQGRTLYLSQPDLAVRWGVCVETIRLWRRDGKIPAADPKLPGRPKWKVGVIRQFEAADPVGSFHTAKVAR